MSSEVGEGEVDVLSSGVDHGRVGERNPGWTEFDWCWYWERDARKAYKKAGLHDPGRKMDCGQGCVCKLKLG